MAKRGGRGSRTTGELLTRLAVAAVVLAALAFAVQGGEYGTTDLWRQKQRKKVLLGSIDSLQHVVDSLKRYRHRLQTDPALQERIAREEFGMVRGNKELLYRFAEPADSTRDSVPR
ncbi:MAG TPA: septum formation initiator family protein [Gemmatimonadaceae bacterium]|jgi:cell division protein FtsB